MIAGSLCQAGGEDVSSIDRKAASWTHMQAAMRMIRKRGGPKASVHTNLKLLFFENYIDLDISGHHGEGQSFFFDDGPKCLSKYLDPIERGTAETRYVCNELTTFLTSCASLSRLHRSTEYAMLSPTRHSALEPSSIIYKIISHSVDPLGKRIPSRNYHGPLLYRLIVLLHINAAL